MGALPWPDHLVTFDEWKSIPENTQFRVEVVEGVVIVAPRPLSLHQRAMWRLCDTLEEQLPGHLSTLPEVEVVIAGSPLPTIRIPDVVVVAAELADANTARYKPSDVSLAIEILSEGSVQADRVFKFIEYAGAGIANYWIVDLDAPVSLTRYLLVDGEYELLGEQTGTVTAELHGHPIKLELDTLVTRRP